MAMDEGINMDILIEEVDQEIKVGEEKIDGLGDLHLTKEEHHQPEVNMNWKT